MANSNRVVAVIPARLDSTRLPRKQFRPVGGNPMLWYLVERMKSVPSVNATIVATTDRPVDDPLVEWCNEYGIEVFRGAHEDLLKRFYAAARAFDAEYVVRANGDNPLLAPEVTEAGIETVQTNNVEFVTGKQKYTNMPVGIGAELLQSSTILKLKAATDDPYHREHVTSYIFHNPGEFDWEPIPTRSEWKAPNVSLTVDTEDELAYIRRVIDDLQDRNPEQWSVEEIITVARSIERNDSI